MRCEAQFLRYQAKAQRLRLLRLAHELYLAVDGDRATVRLDDAHQNLNKCAPACTVLAAEGPNSPGARENETSRSAMTPG